MRLKAGIVAVIALAAVASFLVSGWDRSPHVPVDDQTAALPQAGDLARGRTVDPIHPTPSPLTTVPLRPEAPVTPTRDEVPAPPDLDTTRVRRNVRLASKLTNRPQEEIRALLDKQEAFILFGSTMDEVWEERQRHKRAVSAVANREARKRIQEGNCETCNISRGEDRSRFGEFVVAVHEGGMPLHERKVVRFHRGDCPELDELAENQAAAESSLRARVSQMLACIE